MNVSIDNNYIKKGVETQDANTKYRTFVVVLNDSNTYTSECLTKLMCFVVSIFVRVSRNVPRIVGDIFSACNPFTFSTFVETLLMRTRIFRWVRQTAYCGSRFSTLFQINLDRKEHILGRISSCDILSKSFRFSI